MKWMRFGKDGHVGYGIVDGTKIQAVLGHPLESYKLQPVFYDFDESVPMVPFESSQVIGVGLN